MARHTYIQWTPIPPLNLTGRIDAVVTSDKTPTRSNQKAFPEGTSAANQEMDLQLLKLVPKPLANELEGGI